MYTHIFSQRYGLICMSICMFLIVCFCALYVGTCRRRLRNQTLLHRQELIKKFFDIGSNITPAHKKRTLTQYGGGNFT
uniref:Uncharacterized protein n=1 Tax=Octopus bimaculoides TaxID=37653 RepID=A0A0L8HW55_OCTBM